MQGDAAVWPVSDRGKVERAKGECEHMTFTVGETVVYPHHGAALIEEISKRIIRGEEKLYLRLKVAQGDLTIEVPAENVDVVGVRDVVGKEGLVAVFEVLRAPYTEEPTTWSRRYKANVEKIASGDVIKVAEVVRDLSRRDADRGLSAGEKRMLARARQILVSELALAEKTEEEQAEARLGSALAPWPHHTTARPPRPWPPCSPLSAAVHARVGLLAVWARTCRRCSFRWPVCRWSPMPPPT